MRYEVGEELLQQGTPIVCPTCQVDLTMVHPGTTIPLDQPLSPEPQVQEPEVQAPEPEVQEDEAGAPAEPAPAWDSGDLLGAPAPAEEEPATQEQAPASSPEELSGWGEPTFPPAAEAQPEPEPEPPAEEPAPEPEEEPAAEEPAPEPEEEPAAEEPPQEESAPEPEAASAFPEPEIESEPVQEPVVAFPEPEVPTEPEPAAEEPAQPGWDDQFSSPAAAEPQAPAFETPTWDAPAAPAQEPEAPAAEQAPEPQAPAEPAGAAQPAPSAEPQPGQGGKPDDWASAAARWAASGFSTDNMPDFVRAKEEGQDQALAPPAEATFTPPSEPPPEPQPEIAPNPPFTEGQAPVQQPQEASQAAAPPPLPSPGPPPLEGRGKSVYVMKGSGEGVRDESAPWSQASVGEAAPSTQPLPVSAPAEQTARAQLDLSAPVEEPVAKPASQVKVPKPKHTGLWIILALILIGAGGYLAYHFVMKSRQLDQGKAKDKIDKAGVADTKPEKPPVADSPAADAGAADAGKPPGKAPDQAVAKPVEKKPEKEVKRPPKRKKRKKKVASAKETAKQVKKKSLEYYKKGNELIRKRKYPEAIKFFRKALKANPKLAQAHRGLGICYAQRRQNKKACREYRIYLKMIPSDSKEVPALRQILKGCK